MEYDFIVIFAIRFATSFTSFFFLFICQFSSNFIFLASQILARRGFHWKKFHFQIKYKQVYVCAPMNGIGTRKRQIIFWKVFWLRMFSEEDNKKNRKRKKKICKLSESSLFLDFDGLTKTLYYCRNSHVWHVHAEGFHRISFSHHFPENVLTRHVFRLCVCVYVYVCICFISFRFWHNLNFLWLIYLYCYRQANCISLGLFHSLQTNICNKQICNEVQSVCV